jgi:esterase
VSPIFLTFANKKKKMLRRSSISFTLNIAAFTINGIAPPEQLQRRMNTIRNNRIEPLKLSAAYYVNGTSVDSVADLKAAGCDSILLVAHGLLGSSRNWNGTISRFGSHLKHQLEANWSNDGPVAVVAIDQRNHGNSPHSMVHTMDSMCLDMEFFTDCLIEDLKNEQTNTKRVKSVGIIAHSMSGAVTCNLLSWNRKDATLFPTLSKYLKAALIVDICPTVRPVSAFNSIEEIFEGMKEVDFDKHPTFKEADRALRKFISDPANRSFALTNFVPEGPKEKVARWKCNFPVLYDETISRRLFFEQSPVVHDVEKGDKIEVPTMFVFGEDSPYNSDEGRSQIPHLFSKSEQIAIPKAGHYVHVQQPVEFSKVVGDFFSEKMFGVV